MDLEHLIQTGKISRFPVVIFNEGFHTHIINHVEKMLEEKTISAEDKKMYLITDDVDEAIQFIKSKSSEEIGLKIINKG